MKIVLAVLMIGLLTGCGVQETYETIADEVVESVMATPKQILVDLPGDALAPVLETMGEQVYLSHDYEIIIETLDAGDLGATVEAISGYPMEALTILQTQRDGIDRHEFVWASAGEYGDRLGRAVILDDGDFHYCMSVLRDTGEQGTSQISWEDVFSSFRIAQETPGTAS